MKKIKALCILLLFSITIYAQHDNTLFYMDKVPQSHYMNPSLNPECKWWLGGLIVPIIGQLPPPLHLDINTPIDYNDVIYYGSGAYADSLVTPIHPSQDVNDFLDKLHDNNYITLEYQLNLLYFGFRFGKNVLTFDISDRNYTHIGIPKDIFSLALTGNAVTRDADLSGFTINQNYYREFALGFNRYVNKYFKVGLRGKFLMGIASVYTSKSNIHLITEDVTNEISVKANYEISTNIPIESVSYDASNQFIDSVAFQELAFDNTDFIMDNLVFPSNYGWGVDIGFSKDWNSELTFYGSVVDIGFINWKQNTSTFSLSGDSAFVYKGVEITSLDLDSLRMIPDLDQIFEDNEISYKESSYNTWLPLKIYAGAKYKFTKRLNLGLLARFQRMEKSSWMNAYTASLNVNMFKWGNISLSYSYNNDMWNNIGWGYTIRIGAAQWYVIGDNKIGQKIFPDNTRNLNFRFGCNLVFGRGKRKPGRLRDVPLLNTL